MKCRLINSVRKTNTYTILVMEDNCKIFRGFHMRNLCALTCVQIILGGTRNPSLLLATGKSAGQTGSYNLGLKPF